MFIVDTFHILCRQLLSPRSSTLREAVCRGTVCWAASSPPFMLSIHGCRAYRSYSRFCLVRWHSLLGRWQMCVEYFIWFVKLHNELDYLCLWPRWKLIYCCFFLFNFRSSSVAVFLFLLGQVALKESQDFTECRIAEVAVSGLLECLGEKDRAWVYGRWQEAGEGKWILPV